MSESNARAPRPTIEQEGAAVPAADKGASEAASAAVGGVAGAGAPPDKGAGAAAASDTGAATGTAGGVEAPGAEGEKRAKGWFRRKRGERVPGAVSAHAAREALADADESFTRYAASHKNTVLFGFLGLVLALLIIFLGFWRTLLIAVFVLIGVLIGQALDGDNGIVNFFRQYFGGR